MSVNNKQRRAAKKRKQARGGAGRPSGAGPRPHGGTLEDRSEEAASREAFDLADLLVTAAIRRIMSRSATDAGAQARWLLSQTQPMPPTYVAQALTARLVGLTEGALQGGWSPADLGELVRRQAGEEHLPGFVALLAACPGVPAQGTARWRALVDQLGEPRRLDLHTFDALTSGLRLAALMALVPISAPTSSGRDPRRSPAPEPGPRPDSRKLAIVRALLAKAESTDHDEEAEALSAKAQELISRYALERLLEQAETTDVPDQPDVVLRRIWLDAPYVTAKSTLVHAVAVANRCRSVASDRLGFCTVIGDPRDLDGVELLVTSLLVQASSAMMRYGRQVDRRGQSRTRSFRQSFLISYAYRIGERLQQADEQAVADFGLEQRLLPVLRDQDARLEAAVHAHFPETVQKETTVSNDQGWVAGRAAADLAHLDVRDKIASGARA